LELDRGDEDHREHEQRHQGQLPRQRDQHDESDREQDPCRHELEQAPLHELRHRLDIGGHPRHEHPGLVLIEEPERLTLDVREQPESQLSEEPLSGAVDEQILASGPDERDGDHHRISDDGDRELASISSADTRVDAVTHEQRPDDRRRCRHRHERHRRKHRGSERPAEAGRATDHPAGRRRVEPVLRSDRSPAPHQPDPPTGLASPSAANTSR